MKHPREFGPLPHVRYRPELTICPHCGAPLTYSHPVWAKSVQFLTGIEHLTNLGFRCANPSCAFARAVYRSAQAESRRVKGSGYGLDVIVRMGEFAVYAVAAREFSEAMLNTQLASVSPTD